MQSPAGSIDGRAVVLPYAAAVAEDSGEPTVTHQRYVDGYHFQQQQQLQAAVLQYHQQPVQLQYHQQPVQVQYHQEQMPPLQRHRLSQADSLATSSVGSSALPPPAAVMGLPCGAVFEQQHSQQLMSLPISQVFVPQQYAAAASTPGSGCNSPRQQQQQVAARVLSGFGAASLHGTQQQQQPAASGGALGGSCSKPPRQRQHMSRARSMPMPQSMSWELGARDEDDDADGTEGSAGGDMLPVEDSFSSDYSSVHALRCVSGYSPCPPGGQLCMVLEQAAGTSSGMLQQLSGGQLYMAHPQQQVLLAQGQAVQAVPVVIAQPGCVQYHPYQQPVTMQQQTPPQQQQQAHPLQQQYSNECGQSLAQAVVPVQQQYLQQPYIVQQNSQPLHIPSGQQPPRLVLRSVYSPSPTPAGIATPPLSSSPSMNLNPLAVMAAAGAAAQAARREGASSGAASPNAAAAVNRSGSFNLGMHRRSSSQGGARCQVPPLQVVQVAEASSPPCSSSRDPQSGGDTGCSTPVLGGALGATGVAPQVLLQRLDSLHRSGSGSPRAGSGTLHFLPAPALQSEHSGQLVGVYLATPGSGAPSTAGSSAGTHLAPGGYHHRHLSSRLAIQGSYELPPGALMAPAGTANGAEQQQQQQAPSSVAGGVPAAPSLFLHQAAPHLQPSSRRPSLLRIDSNIKDRSASPFAMVDGNMGHQQAGAAGRSPFAAAAVQSASCSNGGAAPSPFASAASNCAATAVAAAAGFGTTPPCSPFAAATADACETAECSPGAGKSGRRPALLSVASSSTATISSRLPSPFAAASSHSPFAAASTDDSANEYPRGSDPDTGAVDDTTPRSNTTRSPTPGAGDKYKAPAHEVAGIEAACHSSKPVLSPFALLQQAATDDTVDGCQRV